MRSLTSEARKAEWPIPDPRTAELAKIEMQSLDSKPLETELWGYMVHDWAGSLIRKP